MGIFRGSVSLGIFRRNSADFFPHNPCCFLVVLCWSRSAYGPVEGQRWPHSCVGAKDGGSRGGMGGNEEAKRANDGDDEEDVPKRAVPVVSFFFPKILNVLFWFVQLWKLSNMFSISILILYFRISIKKNKFII